MGSLDEYVSALTNLPPKEMAKAYLGAGINIRDATPVELLDRVADANQKTEAPAARTALAMPR